MIRAIIFDFNGVVDDDETPHLLCFQQALKAQHLAMTKEEYYGTYLGMDERTCAAALLSLRDGHCDSLLLHTIVDRKALLFRNYTAAHRPPFFPGMVEFVTQAGARCRLAVASGGRCQQIDCALRDTPIERAFTMIASADDCAIGKPDPAIYRQTLKLLNASQPRPPLITAAECLAVEDSLAGIRSGMAAGMWVLAVATTYPVEKLNEAHLIFPSLYGVPFDLVLHELASTQPPEPSHGRSMNRPFPPPRKKNGRISAR